MVEDKLEPDYTNKCLPYPAFFVYIPSFLPIYNLELKNLYPAFGAV